MPIIVSTPDAFFDCEPWEFDMTINEADGSGPMNLTGSRLFVRFVSLSDNTVIGACDTAADDGSLTVTDGPAGKARFSLPSAGRTWRLPSNMPGGLSLCSTVVGDLYRQATSGAGPKAVARIEVGVLPSTGLPSTGLPTP